MPNYNCLMIIKEIHLKIEQKRREKDRKEQREARVIKRAWTEEVIAVIEEEEEKIVAVFEEDKEVDVFIVIEEMNSKNVTMKMYANDNSHMHEAGSQMKCLKRITKLKRKVSD